jgi:hypothetical protein
MTTSTDGLRKKARKLGLKLSVKNGMFQVFEYWSEHDFWQPVAECWGQMPYSLFPEDVEDILKDRLQA